MLQVTNELNGKDNYSYFFFLVLRLDCSFSKSRYARRFRRKGIILYLCERCVFTWCIFAFNLLLFHNRKWRGDLRKGRKGFGFFSANVASSLGDSLRLNSSFLFTADCAEIYAEVLASSRKAQADACLVSLNEFSQSGQLQLFYFAHQFL